MFCRWQKYLVWAQIEKGIWDFRRGHTDFVLSLVSSKIIDAPPYMFRNTKPYLFTRAFLEKVKGDLEQNGRRRLWFSSIRFAPMAGMIPKRLCLNYPDIRLTENETDELEDSLGSLTQIIYTSFLNARGEPKVSLATLNATQPTPSF